MFRWQNRRKYNRTARDKAAAPRDTKAGRRGIPRREEETIRRARSIGCAISLATCRERTLATGKSRSRRVPTIHFADKRRATETTMVRSGALPKRAKEKSHKTESALRNTTMPR